MEGPDTIERNEAECQDVWRFGEFELDLANRELRRAGSGAGEALALGSRYFDALVLLARHPQELVTKDRFMDEVWRGIPVTDEALTQCIRTIRRALGDDAGQPRFVATVPKHGYRFLAAVDRGLPDTPETSADPLPPPRFSPGGRIAGATTLGGGLAGVMGGLFYGIAGTTGGGMAVLVMAALGAALGVLGGSGVGIGMGAAVSLRGERTEALIAGGAFGGALVGAFGQALGRDGIAALTGAAIPQMTGLFEGLLLGLAAGGAAAFVLRTALGRAGALAASVASGGLAGAVIALSGGALLGRSLMFLEAQFPASHLALSAGLFGQDGFAMTAQLVSSTLEGAVFTGAIAAMLLRVRA